MDNRSLRWIERHPDQAKVSAEYEIQDFSRAPNAVFRKIQESVVLES